MHMINKGRVRWLAKGHAVGQAHFVATCSVSPPKADRSYTAHPDTGPVRGISKLRNGNPHGRVAATPDDENGREFVERAS